MSDKKSFNPAEGSPATAAQMHMVILRDISNRYQSGQISLVEAHAEALRRGVPIPEDIDEWRFSTRKRAEQPDWHAVFAELVLMISSGFVNSAMFSHYVNRIRESHGDQVADEMVQIFNGRRTGFMQDFMG